MKHLFGSLFAIGVAGIAAVAATTAMLNSPQRLGPATGSTPTAVTPPGQTPPPAEPEGKPAVPEGEAKPAPAGSPEAPPTAPATKDAGDTKPATAEETAPEDDKDPYEGVAPEELPPDLQYDADASVSFPTNI
jgi:hypothetical protein